jgi:anti-sigma-K factor RskA
MTCEELQPDYTAFALGIAGEPERSEIEAHLAARCPKCVPGVTSALATVTAMTAAVELKDPPKHLRRRVMSMVGEPEQKKSWAVFLPWAVSGLLAVALVSVSMPRLHPNPDTARLEQALTILNDPLAKDVTFGEAKPSKGRVFVSLSRGVVFIGASLPKLDPGKTFQLWVIPAGGKPVSAGTFHSQADSTAVYVASGPVDTSAAAVAVTIEPEGGSPQPTQDPFIVAPLKS